MDVLSNGTSLPAPLIVKAKYNFEGKNNDELCFRKNDAITISQKLEGGWWEGTLNGRTGWFPSNYVAQLKPQERHNRSKSPSGVRNAEFSLPSGQANKPVYRNYVLNGLIDTERKHVADLQALFSDILQPIANEKILTVDEYTQVTGNLESILGHQQSLLAYLEEAINKPSIEQRVGGEFMKLASTLKTLLKIYCENHPLAVQMIGTKKNELSEFLESRGLGLQNLVYGLSLAFRRLEKYPSILQELDRNMEEGHPDKGDTQRAASVYRTLASFSMQVRKQKEMQMELLNTATIEGWQGPSIHSLGSIALMGPVGVCRQSQSLEDRVDRCLVLFPAHLIIMQVGQQINSFIFLESYNLPGANVKRMESSRLKVGNSSPGKLLEGLELIPEGKSAFELIFSGLEQFNLWLEAFQSCDHVTVHESPILPSEPTKFDTVKGSLSPSIRPQVCTLPSPDQAHLLKKANSLPRRLHSSEMAADSSSPISRFPKPYSGYCLRPIPSTSITTDSTCVKLRSGAIANANDEDDAAVLRIIESYCSSSAQSKIGAGDVQVLVPEDEKLIIEDVVDGQLVIHEKSLVDTVYALREQMLSIQEEMKGMSRQLEKEQNARRRLEQQMLKSVPSPKIDIV